MVGESGRDDGGDASGLSEQDLIAFVQGELSEPERRRVENHLDAHPEDGELVAEFARIYGSDEALESGDALDKSHIDLDQATHPGDVEWGRAPEVGTSLGRYLVIGKLGRGAMGLVLRAYDPKLQREVALKCLAPGRMSSETQARLVREGQAMAKLNHPNVVAVYDVEVLDGRFVLAMEYVEGVDLARWVQREARPWNEVLEVYLQAGRGLVAAHTAGMLHRDFKPANVLVSNAGEVKVTDFGIARLEVEPPVGISSAGSLMGVPVPIDGAEAFGLDSDRLTKEGQVVGTPAYMPPEQFAGQALTGAADQYAFCSSLWHALTGQLPFNREEGERVEFSQLARLKAREVPRWSGPSAVPRSYVDAITRGLSPDPESRWPSMDALLAALAADPLRRRRRLLTAGAVMVVVAAGVGWRAYDRAAVRDGCEQEGRAIELVWSAEQADAVARAIGGSEFGYTAEAWARASPQVDVFAQQWAQVRTRACLDGELHHRLGPQMLARSRSCLDEQRALVTSLAKAWVEPDQQVAERASTAAWTLPRPSACADEDELLRRGDTPGDPRLQRTEQALRVRMADASAQLRHGNYDEALTRARATLQEAELLGRPRLVAALQLVIGDVLQSLGEYDEAQRVVEAALTQAYTEGNDEVVFRAANLLTYAIATEGKPKEAERWSWLARLSEQRLGLPPQHPDRAVSLNNLGLLHVASEEYEEALAAYRQALEIREATLGSEHPEVATILGNMGNVYIAQGTYEQALAPLLRAVQIQEATLGPQHLDVAFSLNNLGNAYMAQGRYEEALAVHERALAIREAALPPEHSYLAITLSNIGNAHNELRDYGKALAAHERALAILEVAEGPEHPDVLGALNNVGNTHLALGRYPKAQDAYERSLTLCTSVHGPRHSQCALTLNNLGAVYKELGQLDRAERHLLQALEIWQASLGDEHPFVASAQLNLGGVRHEQGRYAEALREHERALATWEKTLEPKHPYVGLAHFNIGLEQVELLHPEEAMESLRRALDIFTHTDAPPAELGDARFALARAHWDRGDDRQQAIALARTAIADLDRLAPHRTALIARVRTWVHTRTTAPGDESIAPGPGVEPTQASDTTPSDPGPPPP